MKTFLLFAALLAFTCSSKAQFIVMNNTSSGDVYVTVYAVSTTTCTAVVDQTVTTYLGASSSVSLDVTLPSTWSSASVPTAGTYDLSYAVITRDVSCPGSYGWGAYTGMVNGSPAYYDEVTIGDPGCSFSPTSYMIVTYSGGGTCSNFNCGDTFANDMTYPGGTTVAQIDVHW